MSTPTIAANLRHAARNRQTVTLCGIELAAAKRAGAIHDAAQDLLIACQAAEPLLADMERILNKRMPGSTTSLQALTKVREAITKAIGSRG